MIHLSAVISCPFVDVLSYRLLALTTHARKRPKKILGRLPPKDDL